MATVDFGGKWKLEKNENFDEFLKAINIGMLMRTAASKSSPTLEITQNGDDFIVVTKSAVRTNEIKFKMGEKFTTKDPMEGKDVTMLPTWEGNKQVLTNVNNPDGVKVVRELEGDKLVMTQSKGDVSCRRIFTRC